MGWMMGRMLTQPVLPLLPEGAAEIAPGVGIVTGTGGGGLVTVQGLATFAWDGGDEAGRRLAAVQLVRVRAASQGQVAAAFGVDPATVWRGGKGLAGGGGGAPGAGPRGAGGVAAGPAGGGGPGGDGGGGGGRPRAKERLFRAGGAAAGAGVPGAGGGPPRGGRAPHPACGAGPGAGPGPGAGGQDDIRRKLGELAAAGKAHELVMALAHRHAAAKPDALGVLYADGHARAYYGTRRVQKTHVARLKFPALPPWRPGSPTPAATRCSWSWPSRRSPWPPRSSGCSRSCGRSSARARR